MNPISTATKRFFSEEHKYKDEHEYEEEHIDTSLTKKRCVDSWSVPPSPNLKYAADEAPYLVTTEEGQEIALNLLSRVPSPPNGILLGFAYEFNYNIIANRDIKRAVICDINARMHRVYEWTKANILKFEQPADFLAEFRKEIESYPMVYQSYLATPSQVIEHCEKDFMWTSDLRSYQKIRAMYQSGLITHVNLNLIKDEEYFDSLADWARKNGYVFDSIYVSNIPEWAVRSSGVDEMKRNLLKVLNPNTVFIDAKQVKFESGAPRIRLNQGVVSSDTFPNFKPARRNVQRRRLPLPILPPNAGGRGALNFE